MYKELSIRAQNPYSKEFGILIVDYEEEKEPFGEYLRSGFRNELELRFIVPDFSIQKDQFVMI